MRTVRFVSFISISALFCAPFAFGVGCGGSSSSDAPAGTDAGDDTASLDASSGAEVSESGGADTAIGDATAEAEVTVVPSDPGAPSDTYPAFALDVPQLVNNGGPVLASPEIVTITWPADPHAADFEAFGDKLGSTDYWKTVVSEYGVGPSTSSEAAHIRLTTPVTSLNDADAAQLVIDNASDPTKSGWPAPTANSVYVMYIPSTLDFQLQGSSACSQGVGGYHDSVVLNDGVTTVSYAVVLQCAYKGSTDADVFAYTTVAASHEIGEAATDPQPLTKSPTWVGYDLAHTSWEIWQRFAVENGDNCELYTDADYKSTEVGFAVQRMWSNASFAAGHAPCVPSDGTPYFSVTPFALPTVNVSYRQATTGPFEKAFVEGIHLAVGETKTFQVGYYSDGPTDDWTLRAIEGTAGRAIRSAGSPPTGGDAGVDGGADAPPAFDASGFDGGETGPGGGKGASNVLAITIDNPKGRNGNKATISVTLTKAPTTNTYTFVTIVSTDSTGKIHHFYPVIVSTG